MVVAVVLVLKMVERLVLLQVELVVVDHLVVVLIVLRQMIIEEILPLQILVEEVVPDGGILDLQQMVVMVVLVLSWFVILPK
jgi:hypothetical protein